MQLLKTSERDIHDNVTAKIVVIDFFGAPKGLVTNLDLHLGGSFGI